MQQTSPVYHISLPSRVSRSATEVAGQSRTFGHRSAGAEEIADLVNRGAEPFPVLMVGIRGKGIGALGTDVTVE
jgi:hypothetical protein